MNECCSGWNAMGWMGKGQEKSQRKKEQNTERKCCPLTWYRGGVFACNPTMYWSAQHLFFKTEIYLPVGCAPSVPRWERCSARVAVRERENNDVGMHEWWILLKQKCARKCRRRLLCAYMIKYILTCGRGFGWTEWVVHTRQPESWAQWSVGSGTWRQGQWCAILRTTPLCENWAYGWRG